MDSAFPIQSSDPALLAKARQLAERFAQSYIQAGVSGVVFLGALVRGYFDEFADIDIIAEDIERRQQAFADMFRWALPLVEQQVGLPFSAYSQLV